jgi:hypothetical protein
MKRYFVHALMTLSLVLTACSAVSAAGQNPPQADPVSSKSDSSSNDFATLSNQEGAVTIEVTPLNLHSVTDTLEFNVVLNTHSVEMSMDLATLATLTTDTGISVDATIWDAPRGGHHVEGTLIFPGTKDGKPILEDATKIKLTINNMDTPFRIFEWDLK